MAATATGKEVEKLGSKPEKEEIKDDEHGLPKNPPLELAQLRFTLNSPDASAADKENAKQLALQTIRQDNMASYYTKLCEEQKWPVDSALLRAMEDANAATLNKLESTIKDAKENLGETEVRESLLAKAEHLSRIGEKEATETAFRETSEKTVSLGQRLDIVFFLIRLGMFHGDTDMVVRNLDKANTLMDEGGDWDRKNRLKVYRAVHEVSVRNFKQATSLLLETVSTFTSYEIMEYKDFVQMAVIVSMLTLNRTDLKRQVIHGPEIQEVLHELPMIKLYLNSLYECNYAKFFTCLAEVEAILKRNRLLAAHCRFYIREMRILAYTQLLESYRSVTLESMAKSFGVSVNFMDLELSRFVAAGRLNCKINKVGGVVETNRPDKKNSQYQTTIKKGDLLLNRIQKLSQVINI